MRRAWVRDTLTAAALAVFVTLFFGDILFAGFNLYIRDVARTYYPERRVIAEILRSGTFPFWNPYVNGGQPLAANPAYAVFYPIQWLVGHGTFRNAFHLVVVLHFPLAAVGMYLLTRSLGTRRVVAWLAGFTYALGGPMLSVGSLIPFLYSMAWLPPARRDRGGDITYGFDGAVDTDVTSTNLLPSVDFASLFHLVEQRGRVDRPTRSSTTDAASMRSRRCASSGRTAKGLTTSRRKS
jgi:hypothetical protein